MGLRFSVFLLSGAVLGTSALSAGTGPDSVRVESSIEGRVFNWRVTNFDARAITRFEVPVYSVYHQHVPAGWKFERDSKVAFIAWATAAAHTIRKDQTAEFSVTATSSGAIPAAGTAVLSFEGGAALEVSDVLVPQAERASTVFIPPLVIVGVVVVHSLLTWRRKSKAGAAS